MLGHLWVVLTFWIGKIHWAHSFTVPFPQGKLTWITTKRDPGTGNCGSWSKDGEIMIKGLLQCLSSYESAAQPGTSVQSPMCVKAIDKCIIYPLSNPKTASSIDYDQQVSIISSSFSRLSILFECSHNLNNCTDDEKKRNRKGKDIVVTQNYCFSSKCVRECFTWFSKRPVNDCCSEQTAPDVHGRGKHWPDVGCRCRVVNFSALVKTITTRVFRALVQNCLLV